MRLDAREPAGRFARGFNHRRHKEDTEYTESLSEQNDLIELYLKRRPAARYKRVGKKIGIEKCPISDKGFNIESI